MKVNPALCFSTVPRVMSGLRAELKRRTDVEVEALPWVANARRRCPT